MAAADAYFAFMHAAKIQFVAAAREMAIIDSKYEPTNETRIKSSCVL